MAKPNQSALCELCGKPLGVTTYTSDSGGVVCGKCLYGNCKDMDSTLFDFLIRRTAWLKKQSRDSDGVLFDADLRKEAGVLLRLVEKEEKRV